MINFQEVMRKLLTPASVDPSIAGRPAIVLTGADPGGADDKITSYGALQRLIGRTVAEYRRLGVRSGDAIVFCSPNSPELVAGIAAAWSIGATAIPVDVRLTHQEVGNIAARVNAKVVYTPGFSLPGFPALAPPEFPQEGLEINFLADVKPNTPGLVILTSGTTGMPKGAVHTLGSLMANVTEIGSVFGLTEGKSTLLPLPVSHIFGIEVTLAFLALSGTVVFSDFSPNRFWTVIARMKPALVMAVPTIYGSLLNLPHPGSVSQLVEFYLCGGAPLSSSLSAQFEQTFGKHIVQGYGSTETQIITVNKDGPVNSVGRAIPSVTIEIVDSLDRPLPEGSQGEIRVTGSCLMQGYLNQAEATAAVLHDGHYHTGDIGFIENGWVFISGRSKEMIIVAGNKVFPTEVESVLRQHPLVQEVAVIGEPHQKLGQIVKAIIVVPPGDFSSRLTAGDTKSAREELKACLREFCASRLKRELRPMEWEFRPASAPLPKTSSSKIDWKKLQQQTAPAESRFEASV